MLVDKYGNKYHSFDGGKTSYVEFAEKAMDKIARGVLKDALEQKSYFDSFLPSRTLDYMGKPFTKPIKVSGGDKIRIGLRMKLDDNSQT